MVKTIVSAAVAVVVAALACAWAPAAGDPLRIDVIDHAVMRWNPDEIEAVDRDGFVIRYAGQAISKAIDLPAAPANQRDAMRITLHLEVEPVSTNDEGPVGPSDRWTRLGAVNLIQISDTNEGKKLERTELMRFITGFGGSSHFEQDLTPMAPLLHDRQALELFISTYSTEPAWKASMWLEYSKEGVGARRPVFAKQIFSDPHVTAENPTLSGKVDIPAGLALPRIRVITTGHATDGADGDEFVSRTHVLRVDGRPIAVWRPWSEQGGTLRASNPTSGRRTIDGRELWSSDLDRTGWHPGMAVDPLIIPVPELTPGEHTIQLTIHGIRPKEGESEHHGYWVVSAMVVADEPWPDTGPPRPGTPSAKPPGEKTPTKVPPATVPAPGNGSGTSP